MIPPQVDFEDLPEAVQEEAWQAICRAIVAGTPLRVLIEQIAAIIAPYQPH